MTPEPLSVDEQTDSLSSEITDATIPVAMVQEELGRMVASRHLRTSRRCKEFLQYVVTQKIAGNGGLLKERLIGVQIFGRKPDYPVGEDPVVRVLAGDVRHRLERYHADSDCQSSIVIEIPLGSYAPVFSWRKDREVSESFADGLARRNRPEPDLQSATIVQSSDLQDPSDDKVSGSTSTASDNASDSLLSAAVSATLPLDPGDEKPDSGSTLQRGVLFQRVTLAVIAFVALVGVLTWTYLYKQSDVESKFWLPASSSPKPVLLWLPKPMVYRPSDSLFERYEKSHPSTAVTREGRQDKYLPLESTEAITWGDMVPVRDSGPGIGGVIAAVNMGRLLTEQGIRFEIRFGPEATYAEMRDSPAVIVGAINSDWAAQLTSESHFAFDESIENPNIYETSDARRVWKMEVNQGHKTRDYGLITRQLSGKSGQFVVQVAGVSHFGTEAASEFLLEKGELVRLLSSESISLQKKNLQIVVSTDITNERAGPPHVVAVGSW